MNKHNNFFERYKVTKKLGEGSFGSVFQCINIQTNNIYAIKKITIKKDTTSLKRILREVLLLKYLKHEHLIGMNEACLAYEEQQTSLYFVMELMQMNLRDLIKTKRSFLTNDHIKFYMYQIFLALAYLHYNNIVHRDIKPDNILINSDNVIKIADFGWARHISKDCDLTKMICNIHYRAPEICFRNTIHNDKVDIWSVGCLFYEIITTNVLFTAQKDILLLKSIISKFGNLIEDEITFIEKDEAQNWVRKQGQTKKINPSFYLGDFPDNDAKDLFDKCMEIDPRKRISAFEALNHPYFKEIYDFEEVKDGLIKHSSHIDFKFETDENISGFQLFKRIEEESRNSK